MLFYTKIGGIMSRKQYRVICCKEPFKDDIIVDIAPAGGVTHEMILASRKKQNDKLENYAGSIYLMDIDGKDFEITFGSFKFPSSNNNPNAKKTELYRYYERLYDKLSPLILETYKKMKEAGKEATLEVSLKDYFSQEQLKNEVNNLKSEELKEYAERRLKIEQYKKATLERKAKENSAHKPEVLLAWKQALRRGD